MAWIAMAAGFMVGFALGVARRSDNCYRQGFQHGRLTEQADSRMAAYIAEVELKKRKTAPVIQDESGYPVMGASISGL